MIHLTARLLPSAEVAAQLAATLDEFTRCCQWVQEKAPAYATDMHELRRLLYQPLRRQTTLGCMLCNPVFGVVAAYRKACADLACVDGPLKPQKLVYYSNTLSLKGRQVSILLLPGRMDCPFDLPGSPETDYQTLKDTHLKRADLYKTADGWQLDLKLASKELVYVDEVA